jgi:hypothetical protein
MYYEFKLNGTLYRLFCGEDADLLADSADIEILEHCNE